MPRITRRQCGCTCSNRATWEPEGDLIPDDACSACSGNPCEYFADFGPCIFDCDGLTNTDGCCVNGAGTRGTVSLPKDGCLFEGNCKYVYKDNLNLSTNYTSDERTFITGRRSAILVGTGGECTYRNAPTTAPYWSQFFRTVGSILINAMSTAVAGIPVFGCSRRNYTGLDDQPCGWGDFAGLDCEHRDIWKEFLEDADTFDRWALDINAETFTGTNDSGDTVVYTADDWVCPTTENPDPRNTFTLATYPDEMCGHLPKSVCIYPGYGNYVTACDSAADAKTCCDANTTQACFSVTVNDCTGDGFIDVTVNCDRSPTLPSGVSAPSGVCGYWWGTFSVSCATYSKPAKSFDIGLMVWCTGSGAEPYENAFYCNSSGTWSEVCSATAEYVDCCPNFVINLGACAGESDCCCEPDTGVEFPCCGADKVASTLYVDITSGCSAINGVTATITYQGSIGGRLVWSGSVSAGACGTLYVKWDINATGSCDSVMSLSTDPAFIPDKLCFQVNDQVSCPFVSKTYTATWNGAACPCCSSGSTTVTVSA